MSFNDRRRRLALMAMAAGSSALAASGGGSVGMAIEHDFALPLGPAEPPPEGSPQDSEALYLPELPIVIQALVEPVGKHLDGQIVKCIGPAWRAVLATLAKEPDALRSLTPRQLEELVAASYEKEGFDEVILTPRSGDLGRDVIATKRGFCTIRIIDQVKHYAPEHRVSADNVRALLGVLLSDERATKGFVTTTSTFAPGIETDPFIAKHVPYRLELVDGKSLLERVRAAPETAR